MPQNIWSLIHSGVWLADETEEEPKADTAEPVPEPAVEEETEDDDGDGGCCDPSAAALL